MAAYAPGLRQLLYQEPASKSGIDLDVLPGHDLSPQAAQGASKSTIRQGDKKSEPTNNVFRQVYGAYQLVDPDHQSIYAYTRTDGEETYLVVLNFSDDHVEWDVPIAHHKAWSVVISNFGRAAMGCKLGVKMELGPFDGIVYRRQDLVRKE